MSPDVPPWPPAPFLDAFMPAIRNELLAAKDDEVVFVMCLSKTDVRIKRPTIALLLSGMPGARAPGFVRRTLGALLLRPRPFPARWVIVLDGTTGQSSIHDVVVSSQSIGVA